MTLRESREKRIREYDERPRFLAALISAVSTRLSSRSIWRQGSYLGIIGDSESNGRKVRPCRKYAIIASSLATCDSSRHGISHAAPLTHLPGRSIEFRDRPNRFDTRGLILNRVPVTLSPTSASRSIIIS